MKITTTGSLGNVAKLLVKQLITAGDEVTVITTSSDRAANIEALGAKAAIGRISDAAFLNMAFAGADAVFAMVPPAMEPANMIEAITRAGEAYARAIQSAGVPRVVLLSSVGADVPEGTGPVQAVHRVEQIFSQLTAVNVTVVRSGFFYVNFLRDIPLLKSENIFGNNYNGADKLALTHPEDLATAIAQELQTKGDGYEVKYAVSDISTGNELAAVFGKAIGKPDLTWTNIPDEQLKEDMITAGLPAPLSALITELGQAVRAGIVIKDFLASGGKTTGHTKLQQFAEEFKSVYERT
jgi:uncharacterized protein YbjT (DUF2867 family)